MRFCGFTGVELPCEPYSSLRYVPGTVVGLKGGFQSEFGQGNFKVHRSDPPELLSMAFRDP